MVVNRDVLWLLLAVCCVPGVVLGVRWRLGRARSRAAGVTDGVLVGLGGGLAVACAVTALAVLAAHLS